MRDGLHDLQVTDAGTVVPPRLAAEYIRATLRALAPKPANRGRPRTLSAPAGSGEIFSAMADRAEYLATARGESLTRQQAVESGLREFAETRKKQGAPGFDDVDTWVTENLRRAVLEDGRLRKARSEAMESWLRAHLTS